ncbi:hypothetical protein [Kurthia senegalensis]|uniref:hypothetical protein n=1 Tax=Kurthia senegalensis TaxID=1033740 RepID=UPI000287FB11|nr:hypothetical protein [Kurthia senegalensis]
MAKKNNYLLAAAIAGAAAYLRKPENREKAWSTFNDVKGKVTDLVADKKQQFTSASPSEKEAEETISPTSNESTTLNAEQKPEHDVEGGIVKES